MTDFDLDYVVVPDTVTEPSAELVAALAGRLSGVGPIVVCRRIHDAMSLAALPAPVGEIGGRSIQETWSTSLAWLERALTAGLDDAVAARLIVRVPWPIGLAEEMTLLSARLSAPSVRLAVEITPATAEDVFHYLNRLEQDWIAMPAHPGPACAEAMAKLGRLWLFDPRTRTSMEPVVNALGALFRSVIGHDEPGWRLHVGRVGEGWRRTSGRWTPSLHALLRAGSGWGDPGELERVAAFDGRWIDALTHACAGVDADAVHALAAAAAAGRSTR